MSEEKMDLKKWSKEIFEVIRSTPFYYAPRGIIMGTGLEEDEIHSKPFIGIVIHGRKLILDICISEL